MFFLLYLYSYTHIGFCTSFYNQIYSLTYTSCSNPSYITLNKQQNSHHNYSSIFQSIHCIRCHFHLQYLLHTDCQDRQSRRKKVLKKVKSVLRMAVRRQQRA